MQTQSEINLDRSFFTVLSKAKGGEIYQPELESSWDRRTVLEMAKEGQFDDVQYILEFNPIEQTNRIINAELIDDEIEVEDRNASRRNSLPFPRDPNREHRICSFEAGTGSFGPFGGRAA